MMFTNVRSNKQLRNEPQAIKSNPLQQQRRGGHGLVPRSKWGWTVGKETDGNPEKATLAAT
jgi:hypothetical protein